MLSYVAETRLFTIPDVLMPFANEDKPGGVSGGDIGEEEEIDLKSELGGWLSRMVLLHLRRYCKFLPIS